MTKNVANAFPVGISLDLVKAIEQEKDSKYLSIDKKGKASFHNGHFGLQLYRAEIDETRSFIEQKGKIELSLSDMKLSQLKKKIHDIQHIILKNPSDLKNGELNRLKELRSINLTNMSPDHTTHVLEGDFPNLATIHARENDIIQTGKNSRLPLNKINVIQYDEEKMIVPETGFLSGHPYRSAQEKERLDHNLNGAVMLDGKIVVCRHLATYATHLYESKNNEDVKNKKFSNLLEEKFKDEKTLFETMQNKFSNAENIEQSYLNIISNSKDISYVCKDYWGHFLEQQFKDMQEQNISSTEYLVNSLDHTMAMSLSIKNPDRHRQKYVIKFYDPNQTVTHLRLPCSDIEAIRSVNIKNFLTEEQLYNYKLQRDSAIFFKVNQEQPATENSSSPVYTTYPAHEEIIKDIFLIHSNIEPILKYAPDEIINEMFGNIKQWYENGDLTIGQMRALISKRNSTGFSLLFSALWHGDAKIAKEMLDIMKPLLNGEDQNNDKIIRLFLSSKSSAKSTLRAFQQSNNIKGIRAVSEVMVQLYHDKVLNKEQISEFFLEKNSYDNSVLGEALGAGQTEFANAMLDIIKQLKENGIMDGQWVSDRLSDKTNYGNYGASILDIALWMGQTEVANIIIDHIVPFNSPSSHYFQFDPYPASTQANP